MPTKANSSTNGNNVSSPSDYEITKSSGGVQNFMHSYGLKSTSSIWSPGHRTKLTTRAVHEPADVEEYHAIADAMRNADHANRSEAAGGQKGNGGGEKR